MKNVNLISPSKEARKEAQKNPNGYVYVIDEEYASEEDVPAEYIVGCWKVNEKGTIVGPFIPNPNHHSKLT